MQTFRIGLIINPVAGIGGAVGLKGSDGRDIQARALALGAVRRSGERTRQALEVLLPVAEQIEFAVWPGAMGEELVRTMGFAVRVSGHSARAQTSAKDTKNAVQWFVEQGVDLLLFAGGDGTARDVCDAAPAGLPVLGIPAGVKIHSGVYAISPTAAGKVLLRLVQGQLVDIHTREVRDIDEQAFREGKVRARYYGEMTVPEAGQFLQNVKQGGREIEALVLQDIADHLREELDDEVLLIAGPGSTTAGVLAALALESTLLGIDIIRAGQVLVADATEQDILAQLAAHTGPVKLLVTAIGGQGHIFGRGNQQLSAGVLEQVLTHGGPDSVWLVATKTKLKELDGRPLRVDTGSVALNHRLSGFITVHTGYQDAVLYPVEAV